MNPNLIGNLPTRSQPFYENTDFSDVDNYYKEQHDFSTDQTNTTKQTTYEQKVADAGQEIEHDFESAKDIHRDFIQYDAEIENIKRDANSIQKDISFLEDQLKNNPSLSGSAKTTIKNDIAGKKRAIAKHEKNVNSWKTTKENDKTEEFYKDFKYFLTKRYAHLVDKPTMEKMLDPEQGKRLNEEDIKKTLGADYDMLMSGPHPPNFGPLLSQVSNGNIIKGSDGNFYYDKGWTNDDAARFIYKAESRLATDFINKKPKQIGELPSLTMDASARFRIAQQIGGVGAINYLNLSQFIVNEIQTSQNSRNQSLIDEIYNKKVGLGFWGRLDVVLEAVDIIKGRAKNIIPLMHDWDDHRIKNILPIKNLTPNESLAQLIRNNYQNANVSAEAAEKIAKKLANQYPEFFYNGLNSDNVDIGTIRVGMKKVPRYILDTINDMVFEDHNERS